MVGTFVGLKLRLLRNQLRRGSQQILGLTLMLAMVVIGAGGMALVIATGSASMALFADLFVVFAAALCAGWSLVPIAATGVDSTLDVSRLALLPLTWRTHGPGLFASSLVGVGPLATVVVLAGFLFQASGAIAVVGVALAVAVQTVQVVLLGRITVAALGALLLRRRTRELAFSLGALLTATVGIGVPYLSGGAVELGRAGISRWAARAGWNPFGFGGRAGSAFLLGRPTAGAGFVAASVSMIAASAIVWWWLIGRELTTISGDHLGSARRRRRFRATRPTGAVVQRELRYLWRHPVARTNTVTAVFLALLIFLPRRSALGRPDGVLTACVLVGSVGLSALNMLAVDGRAVSCDVLAAPVSLILTGKALARLIIGMVLVVTASVVLAAVNGGWGYVPAVAGISLGLFGPLLGVGVFASVAVPVPVPDVAGGNPWSSTPGNGCVTAIAATGLLVVSGLAALPVVLAVVASQWSGSAVALGTTAMFAPVYGWFAWRAGLRLAARRTEGRLPELLVALTPN